MSELRERVQDAINMQDTEPYHAQQQAERAMNVIADWLDDRGCGLYKTNLAAKALGYDKVLKMIAKRLRGKP